MSNAATDLFSIGSNQYITLVDRAAGYLLAEQLKKTDSKTVISVLTRWFNTLGWPRTIKTDGGPQFRGDFRNFCRENQIRHELSPVYHPQSNGLAEAAVKNAKTLALKCSQNSQDFQATLYQWRNFATTGQSSPAQLHFGQRQNLQIPNLPS